MTLETCSHGGCQALVLPKEGVAFRLEGSPGEACRLLAFPDADGNGILDQGTSNPYLRRLAERAGLGGSGSMTSGTPGPPWPSPGGCPWRW